MRLDPRVEELELMSKKKKEALKMAKDEPLEEKLLRITSRQQ